MELRKYLRFFERNISPSIRISRIGIKQICHEAINAYKFDIGIEMWCNKKYLEHKCGKCTRSKVELKKNDGIFQKFYMFLYFLLVYIHLSCFCAFNLVFHGLLIVVLDFLVNSCIVPSLHRKVEEGMKSY